MNAECQEGFYGQDCVGVCQCQNEASCDFGTGSCDCGAGWMGQFCNMSKYATIQLYFYLLRSLDSIKLQVARMEPMVQTAWRVVCALLNMSLLRVMS